MFILRFFLVASLLTVQSLFAQELQVFESFAHQAVLQRDVAHPFWGWAAPKTKVEVKMFTALDKESFTYRTKADANGRWSVTLDAQPAGGPYRFEVRAKDQLEEVKSVYFGDVYLLSGQSNMEWKLEQSDPEGERRYEVADPLVRELKVEKTFAAGPQHHLPLDQELGDQWRVATPENTGTFSAVGIYFAHYLRKEQDVPIGLINSSWGGSRIEPWMSPAALGLNGRDAMREQEDATAAASRVARRQFEKDFPGREIPTEDRGEELGWLTADFDDSNWPTMTLPTHWEPAGYRNVDGYFYFRSSFELTAEQAAAPVTLRLGAIDDGDWTYLNGEKVGSTPNDYQALRAYVVPPDALRTGENQLAIRVYDRWGGGGFSADPSNFYVKTVTGNIDLAGPFKFNVGEFRVESKSNQIPTILYNAMIAPLEGLPLSGVLWYQGESNSGNGDNLAYEGLMRSLVEQWRGFFAHPDVLPFYWVQLANFMAPVSTPNEPGWAVVRGSQSRAADLPKTGYAVITDIGEADDIHPKNKWEVGRRLSLHVLKDVYGLSDVRAQSPVVDRVVVSKGSGAAGRKQAVVSFKHIPDGLTVKGGNLYGYVTGFTVQDAAGEWHFARATFEPASNTVRLINPAGTGIERVRYNWANNPDGNLFSREGLPVDGFDVEVE